MVKLTKIYTRSGDQGQTGLGSGQRVPKTHPRVEAYGAVDETNAFLGKAVISAKSTSSKMSSLLEQIQHDLFDVGADLCTPIPENEVAGSALRITSRRVQDLEDAIDMYNADLESLKSFVLPGGSQLAADLHVVRTVCRRTERNVLSLIEVEPDSTSILTLQYLNRLSDLFFVLARVANDEGKTDVLWIPGKNRTDSCDSNSK